MYGPDAGLREPEINTAEGVRGASAGNPRGLGLVKGVKNQMGIAAVAIAGGGGSFSGNVLLTCPRSRCLMRADVWA